MRLTDDPQPLQAMRPEVAWPQDLQVVMDKALARDANQRYRSAHDFAVDLVEAIDRMPATSITTMGTQVLAPPMTAADIEAAQTAATVQVQVPPTRVAAKSGGGGAKATPPAPSPAHTPTSSKTPLMAGIGAVVLVGAIGGAMVLKPWASKTGPDTANSSQPGLTTPPVTDSGKPAASSGTPSTTPAPVQLNNSLVNVSDSLKRFSSYLELNSDSASAARILERLSTIEPKTPTDKVNAALVTFTAKLAVNDEVTACAALKDVQELSARTALKSTVEKKLKDLCPS